MKTMTFDGRIGASGAEVRTTKGGKPYVRFSVANNSFANGAEKTEWYEVTSYDEYIINNRVKYLTKGTYVIITGNPNIEVNVRDGKIWLNQYITATTIDTPSFKKKEDETSVSESVGSTQTPTVSTFTGGTSSTVLTPNPEPAPSYASSVASESSGMVYGGTPIDDDDMPF
jgi:single-stranded DNA-binding protein